MLGATCVLVSIKVDNCFHWPRMVASRDSRYIFVEDRTHSIGPSCKKEDKRDGMKRKTNLIGGVEESKEEPSLTKPQMDVGEVTNDKNATPIATESCRLDTGDGDKVRQKNSCGYKLVKMWDNGFESCVVFLTCIDIPLVSIA